MDMIFCGAGSLLDSLVSMTRPKDKARSGSLRLCTIFVSWSFEGVSLSNLQDVRCELHQYLPVRSLLPPLLSSTNGGYRFSLVHDGTQILAPAYSR